MPGKADSAEPALSFREHLKSQEEQQTQGLPEQTKAASRHAYILRFQVCLKGVSGTFSSQSGFRELGQSH